MTKNKLKWWQWLLIGVVGLLVLLGIPYLLNYFIQQPRRFEVVGNETHWLSFWVTYIAALASFAMVFITWRTLQQNKRLVEEQTKPNLIFEIQEIGTLFYLVITNRGNAPAYDVELKLSGDFLVYPMGMIKCTDLENNIPVIFGGQIRHICLKVLADKSEECTKNKILSVNGKYLYNNQDIAVNINLTSNHGFPQSLLQK